MSPHLCRPTALSTTRLIDDLATPGARVAAVPLIMRLSGSFARGRCLRSHTGYSPDRNDRPLLYPDRLRISATPWQCGDG